MEDCSDKIIEAQICQIGHRVNLSSLSSEFTLGFRLKPNAEQIDGEHIGDGNEVTADTKLFDSNRHREDSKAYGLLHDRTKGSKRRNTDFISFSQEAVVEQL